MDVSKEQKFIMKLRICGSDHGCPLLQFNHAVRKSGYMGNHRFPNIAIKRTRALSEEFRFSRSGADTGRLKIRVRSRFASAGLGPGQHGNVLKRLPAPSYN